ncbi:MAG: PAS domain S-box protein [Deltaproteobacteria bacterium]|nr:PAS domain S-box protein [Deltaproteobacteria bacterium]
MLLQRIHALLWIVLCGLFPYSLIDPFVSPELVLPLYLLRAILGAVLIAGLLILRRHPTNEWVVWVGMVSIAATCFTAAVSGVIVNDDSVTPILAVTLVMSSAALLPWGMAPHVVTIVVTLVASLWNVYEAHGTLPGPSTYVVGALVGVWIGSIYLAHQLDRDRFALAEHDCERRRAEQALEHRAEFEQLVIDISRNFINAAPAEIESGITTALKAVGEFAGVDRSYVFLFSNEGATMDLAYEWAASDTDLHLEAFRGLPVMAWPWFMEKLRRFEVVHTPRVGDLPPEANAEREILQSRGTQSTVNVPMVSGHSLVGFLGLRSMRSEKAWEPESIALLRIVGEIFVNALARKRAEEALRASEERYRSLVENLNEVVFAMDRDGTFTYFSHAIERAGYAPEEIIGQPFSRFIHPDDLSALQASFARTLAGQLEPAEFRIFGKQGELCWFRTSSRLQFDSGAMVGVTGILTDITERKRAEDALRASEERYRELFENANDIVYVHDLRGNFVSMNWAAERVTGYSRHEAVTMHVSDVVAPEYLQAATLVTERQLAGERGPITYELEILAKDGHRVPLEISSRVVLQDGKPIGVQGVARDITERKKAEAALVASREQLEQEAQISAALARVGQELIASLDAAALLDRLCRITTEVMGCDCCHTYFLQPNEDVFVPVAGCGDTPEQWEAIRVFKVPRALLAGLEQGLVHGVMAQLPGTAAALIAARYGVTVGLAAPLRRGGEIIGILAAAYRGRQEPFTLEQERIARGVAQLASFALQNARLVAELEHANRVKSDFVATMSHELRSPLHQIIGYTGLLLDGEFGGLAPQQEDSLRRLDKSARELLNLINNTLDLSRLETGRVPLELKEIGVAALLDEIAAEMRRVIEKPGVSFEWQVDSQLPRLRTDPVKLKLIIKNLIGNAAKFTEQGRVTVAVRGRRDGVEFAVTDTGIGITAEARAIIFEPFRQAHDTTARYYGGAGLGLYIVRRLLDMLGGTIAVESEVGHGSTFRVWLPLDAGPTGGAASVASGRNDVTPARC